MFPTPRCPHCTNEKPDLLEALDTAGVCWLCTVCARTFVNPVIPEAVVLNR